MRLYELICAGQDRMLSDPSMKVPGSHFISQQDIRRVVPDLQSDSITGGVVFYESHMHSSERMTLGFIETAQQHGACVANYVAVESLLGVENSCISGVRVKDQLSGDKFEFGRRW